MYLSSILWLLSLPVFIYLCYLLARLALKFMDKQE
jgi:hypothetical protein